MNIDAQKAVESALADLQDLKLVFQKRRSKQISSVSDKQRAKTYCLSWFNQWRPAVQRVTGDESLKAIDTIFQSLLEATTMSSRKTVYVRNCRDLQKQMGSLLASHSLLVTAGPSSTDPTDAVPDFSRLATDPRMQQILVRRWQECIRVIEVGASLSAIVMMGGLLEALLISKTNQLTDKTLLFKAKNAPKDKSGKVLPLQQWGLKNYIDVSHELNWITVSAKNVGDVLRNYRNYIHPHKELTDNAVINEKDAKLLWQVAKAIARQLLT